MKVYAVFDTETNNRASKWYERMGDARRRSNELNKWKDKYEAKECHISFNEPKTLNIPKLEDFRICSVKRELLTDGGVYVEISMENEHGIKLSLKGGYEN